MSPQPPPLPPHDADEPIFLEESFGEEGERIDGEKGHIFPCEGCGSDLIFDIHTQKLKCQHCGFEKVIGIDPDKEIEEQDFYGMLAHLQELRDQQLDVEDEEEQEVRCESCGATLRFVGTLTSSECPYCASPIQLDKVHTSEKRVPVDAVLPFQVDEDRSRLNLKAWVKSLWFAPNDFVEKGAEGQFHGVYLPYFTFDSLTSTYYSGQRGEYYYVTVGTGKNRRRERRTRWYPASGNFQRFFDDVVILASWGLPRPLIRALEPFPMHLLVPFKHAYLAGFTARTYDVELEDGFVLGKQRMDDALYSEVCSRIGGDTQRVDTVQSQYDAITYKHLLLPLWLMSYKYKGKLYQVAVNAATGEVNGERPYSWIKITLACLAAALGIGGGAYLFNQ
ncbi:DNA-directed RNA polymerase subunit P [Gimesia chilikensis]|uniref:DNA-directed RNA polymerase subunit P n=1 Tax=Gimesia chilikensis TaxID=2605989 RepID=A0A517WFA2_9PLAN|nr:hypothetical protein [Gimesia chilikensis]QDU03935.1 DNA-directed RNA polymerase subunit P [Gimesia chilikensis]